MFTGIISMLIIPVFLTKPIQGYWYSFGSISAMSVLANLGFSSIILQFSAHECAFLKFSANGCIEGDEMHLQRLFSFFQYILKRTIFLVVISFPILFIVGFFILSGDKSTDLNVWLLPWIIYIIFSGLSFLLAMLTSFFEGCGYISEIQKQRSFCIVINWGVIIACLFLKMSLYALALGMLFSSVLQGILLWMAFKKFIIPFVGELKIKTNWNKEISKLLMKYALSFVGGFLFLQLFTPIAFHFYGPVFAGQVGISITLATSIFQIANIWIYVIMPKMNMLASKKKIGELFAVFKKNFVFSVATFIFASFCAMILLVVLPESYSSRFLPLSVFFILLVAWLLQLIINNLATLSRSFKVEKFVMPSLVMGIYTAVITFAVSVYLSEEYFFAGFFSAYIFVLPWFIHIYHKHKIALYNGL
jgi:O-antigen/teichoic acid export membrane protein